MERGNEGGNGCIEINNYWSLVPKASGMNIIECKWVYKIKKEMLLKTSYMYKARLVTKGYNQEEGIDYTSTIYIQSFN